MKNLILTITATLLFLGCDGETGTNVNVEPHLVKGKSLQQLTLNDQFDKPQSLSVDTKKVIFAFSKDMGHIGNDFFAAQDADYLTKRDALFVADISQAPSLIRSMFVLPGLKDLKHSVMLITEDSDSAQYKPQSDFEKIMIVDVNTYVITGITYVSSADELKAALQ